VNSRAAGVWESKRFLLWTAWHLEIIRQIDPGLRQDVRFLSELLARIAKNAHTQMRGIRYHLEEINGARRLICESDKGVTLLATYRSLFWGHAQIILTGLNESRDPQIQEQAHILRRFLADPVRMDFLVIMLLLKFRHAPGHKELVKHSEGELPDVTVELEAGLEAELGWLLANY